LIYFLWLLIFEYYGSDADNGAELYITGDNVTFRKNSVGNTMFDSVGANSDIHDNTIMEYNFLYFNNYSSAQFKYNTICTICEIKVFKNAFLYEGNQQNAEADVFTWSNVRFAQFNCLSISVLYGAITGLSVGVSAHLTSLGFSLVGCTIGDGVTFTASGDNTSARFVNIDSMVYKLGVTTGAVTATAV